jgi:hypothetical protein
VCGSTIGALGLFLHEGNAELVIQGLVTLTEYCQGPCEANQVGRGARRAVNGRG